MKKEWKAPTLEVLDVSLTMKGPGGSDKPGHGGDKPGHGNGGHHGGGKPKPDEPGLDS